MRREDWESDSVRGYGRYGIVKRFALGKNELGGSNADAAFEMDARSVKKLQRTIFHLKTKEHITEFEESMENVWFTYRKAETNTLIVHSGNTYYMLKVSVV